jgi:membrane protein implicated in regulation of membrane protease activity
MGQSISLQQFEAGERSSLCQPVHEANWVKSDYLTIACLRLKHRSSQNLMETIYWICLVVGGGFVLLSIMGGFDGLDADADLDADLDGDIDLSPDVDTDIEFADPGKASSRSRFAWLGMLKSVKFWTFGSCFFGLTGTVLSRLAVQPILTLILAVLMGLVCGSAIALTLRSLYRRQVNSLVKTTDLVGLLGTVEVPLSASSRGKVRLQVKGTVIDFIASTTEGREFRPGEPVLVVGMEQNNLWVVSAQELNTFSTADEE